MTFMVAFRHGRTSIREAYEERFSVTDGREVTVHRVVNFVERRNSIPREFDRGFDEDQWYGDPRKYQDTREYQGESSYMPCDRRYFDDSPKFHRNSPPPRYEAQYSQRGFSKHDLRHHLSSRNRSRAGPFLRNRGRGSGPSQVPERKAKSLHSHPDHDDFRSSPPLVVKRDRSPGSRETQPPVRSGSNTSNRSFSPDKDKGHNHQPPQKKHKPSVVTSHPPSNTVEDSPHNSGSSKEKTPVSAAETEEVVATSMEPKLTREESFKARRSEAIKAKALEIKELYRKDCETFCTVVKMLVAKEPSLDHLLQSPLEENLLEIKQRCLDDLRHFVKELDEMIARGKDEPDQDSLHVSTNHVWKEEESPQLSSINPAKTDGTEEGRRQPGNTEDPAHAPTEDLGGGKQTGNTEFTLVTEICQPERQENLAPPGPEESYSKPMTMLSESTTPSAQPILSEGHVKRLQLYGRKGEKLSNFHLSNPKIWENITYIRPGWVPQRLPFLPVERYWELKANSTVVSTSTPSYLNKDHRIELVTCGVTCYIHAEGPWCEVQANNGTRICILAADPPAAQMSPLI